MIFNSEGKSDEMRLALKENKITKHNIPPGSQFTASVGAYDVIITELFQINSYTNIA